MSNLPKINISDLLDAGIHFGHKSSRWNPKMAPYLYGVRDNIHIIDLQQTAPLMKVALKKIYETVKGNGKVLFVSSKIQATDVTAEYAEKCGQFYVNNRWLGGTLTNWKTISKSIKKLDDIEKTLSNDKKIAGFTKKEVLNLDRAKTKLLKSFAGIRKMGGRPDLVIIIDTNREHLAISEAVNLNIPIVAIVDSNSNPDNIDYPIPGNDDAIRSIKLYCNLFSEAALKGIQDSLANSGLDAGSIEKVENNTLDGVKKIKKADKLSKTQSNLAKSKSEDKKLEAKEETSNKKKASQAKDSKKSSSRQDSKDDKVTSESADDTTKKVTQKSAADQ